jgi:hypothetical protein
MVANMVVTAAQLTASSQLPARTTANGYEQSFRELKKPAASINRSAGQIDTLSRETRRISGGLFG